MIKHFQSVIKTLALLLIISGRFFSLKHALSVDNFEIICLTETQVGSSTLFDNVSLIATGSRSVLSDHLPNSRDDESAFIYCKDFSPLRAIRTNYLNK